MAESSNDGGAGRNGGALEALGPRAERVGAAVLGGAEDVARRVGSGLKRASDALAAPTSSDVEGLFAGAELPELVGDDPIGALAVRLDREADLWRSLALRALARAAWADRVAQVFAILGAVGCAALSAIAAFGLVFWGGSSPDRVGLFAAGVLSLIGGAALQATVSAFIRRSQRRIAHDAAYRAERAEKSLLCIGLALARRKAPDPRSRESLEQLGSQLGAP